MRQALADDPWATVDAAESATDRKVDQLVAKGFSPSLVARAKRRLEAGAVQQISPTGWLVAGDAQLGDTRTEYAVTYSPAVRRYACSCWGHLYGDIRAAKLCSHVLAVQLWRVRHRPQRATSGSRTETDLPEPGYFWTQEDGQLPGWVKAIRPHQWRAVQEIVLHFEAGKKVVLLEAPTGAGKSLIGEMVRRMLRKRGLYLCTTKSLQDQYVRDFQYAVLLKGRANYPTRDYPDRFSPPLWLSAADCDKEMVENEYGETEWVCTYCDPVAECPYELAKAAAMSSRLVTSNVAYFLAEANHVGKLDGWPLVVIDEADLLESELMRYIEVVVSPKWQRELKLGKPERVTMPEAWEAWIEKAIPKVRRALDSLNPKAGLQEARNHRSLSRLLQDLQRVQGKLADGSWVYVGQEQQANSNGANGGSPDGDGLRIAFKPVTVRDYAETVLWDHAERFLLMSATLVSAQQVADDLGLAPDEWASVNVDSQFPPERRPIYVLGRATLTHDTEAAQWPSAREAVDEILDRYAGHRVLIHTVSYRRAERLLRESRHAGRMLTYRTAQERSEAIERFQRTEGSVLVAPSLERGVDLPNDLCRCVIVLKVPYPDYGDRQVRARLRLPGGRGWYLVQTVRSMVQMTGRGMRHRGDWCDSYIIDRQFIELWNRNRGLFPKWWREAVWFGDKKTPVGARPSGQEGF